MEEIRKIIVNRISGVKAKNVDQAIENFREDVISYDVVGELKFVGIDAVRNRLKEWFSTLSEIIDFEISDIKITSASDISFCSSLNHISARMVGGNILDMWWRETTCYVKSDGIWKITHAHSSVPFDASTGKASLGLKPNVRA